MIDRRLLRDRDMLAVTLLLAVRVAVFAIGSGVINGDGFLYIGAAQHIVTSGFLPEASFQARSYSVAIAPIVALFGRDVRLAPLASGEPIYGHPIATAVHWCQLLIDLAVVVALLHLCFVLLRDRPRARRLAVIVVALQPITAAWTNFVVPDTLATGAFFVGLFYISRALQAKGRFNLLVGGLLLGVAAVIRIDVAALAAAVLVGWVAILVWRGPAEWRWRGALIGALALLAVPPLAMTSYQYASSGDPRYVRTDGPDNPWQAKRAYFAWARAWVASRAEYGAFILSIDEPAGLNADAYPARALPQPGDREALRSALRHWSTAGYDGTVDAAFSRLADAQPTSRPVLAYLTAPAMRAGSMWVSPEGAAALALVVGDGRVGLLVKIAVVLLKAVIALLAAIGAVVLVRRIVRARRRVAFVCDYPASLVFLSAAAFVLRFAEMWALNVVGGGAIIEPRYAIETWPGIIAAALYGYRAIIDAGGRRRAAPAQ